MSRTPSYDIAELEARIGMRGDAVIDSSNRALVQNWLCAQGFPSLWCKKKRIKTLNRAYNDRSELNVLHALLERGELDMGGIEDSESERGNCEICGDDILISARFCSRKCAVEAKKRAVRPIEDSAETDPFARDPDTGERAEPLPIPVAAYPAPFFDEEEAFGASYKDREPAHPMTIEGGAVSLGELLQRAIDERAKPAVADTAADLKLQAAAEALRAAAALAQTHEAVLSRFQALETLLQSHGIACGAAKPVTTHGVGTLPGTEMVNAGDLFDGIAKGLMVPRFSDTSEYVPELDSGYVFDPQTTHAILLGFASNRRVLISGRHGTGKTSHIEQVAARLNWPFLRLNLDGHISRTDMIGRDSIVIEDGKQITQFKEGILPWAMQQPMALCLDEYDAGRPDVLFVVQRLLEANGKLTIAEQNRVVAPNAGFRLFGTANTVGLGDASGLYHGTNALNAAQMDRWSMTVRLDYLPAAHEVSVLRAKCPHVPKETARAMVKTAAATRALFAANKISTVMSPRTVITWGENAALMGDDYEAAFNLSFLNKCDDAEQDNIRTCYRESFPGVSSRTTQPIAVARYKMPTVEENDLYFHEMRARGAIYHGAVYDVRYYAAHEKKVIAIKRHREETGMGLKESKDYIEAIMAGYLPFPETVEDLTMTVPSHT